MNTLQQSFADFLAYRRRHRTGPAGDNPFGQLRATVPIARAYGFSRGKPIDRFYIERYLEAQAPLVRGRVLEIGDNEYTLTYGDRRVTQSDILHFDATNPKATFVGDLSRSEHIPDALFDCIILTQTLHLIYDIRPALRHVHRLLKPGGALVATFPGMSQISDENWGPTWCWGWSPGQAEALLRQAFPGGRIRVEALGNRFAAVAFLHGLVTEEVDAGLLTAPNGACAFLVGAVAERAGEDGAEPDS
jgi:SAM-dependent methyltransferase